MLPCREGPVLKWAGRKRRVPSAWMRRYFEAHVTVIPDGWQVHHRCENPWCIEPTHLAALPPEVHRAQHVERPYLRKRPFPILH